MSDHPTEDDLSVYAFDPESADQPSRIARHLAECSDCAALLHLIETTDAGLFRCAAWEEADEQARPAGSLGPGLQDLVTRIATEDADAARMLEPLVSNPVALARMNLAERPKYRSGGVVRHLIRAAGAALELEPLEALAFADAAIEVAESLPDDTYPASAMFDLRGSAWNERADALRILGRYDEALAALDRAAETFAHAPLAPLGPASVKLIRATIESERGALDEAYALAQEASKGFRECGDRDREMRARQIQAAVRFRQGDVAGARALYESILEYGRSERNLLWTARAARLIGSCELEAGDLDAARRHFDESVAMFSRLGLAAESLRSEWGLARVAVAEGRHPDAIKRFRDLQQRFRTHGQLIDAALVALDAMDSLYALGDVREIARMAMELAETFAREGILTAALTAFAWLGEVATPQEISPAAIEHVRQFTTRSEREPMLLFAPPRPR